jgi:hypothetical protein
MATGPSINPILILGWPRVRCIKAVSLTKSKGVIFQESPSISVDIDPPAIHPGPAARDGEQPPTLRPMHGYSDRKGESSISSRTRAERNAIAYRAWALDAGSHNTTKANKKPSPYRVAREGFMAACICRREADKCQSHAGFRWLQDEVNPMIKVLSSPFLGFRSSRPRRARLATRGERAPNQQWRRS